MKYFKQFIVSKFVEKKLTNRQIDVALEVLEGRTSKEIAKKLELGLGTVKMHITEVYKKMGYKNRSSFAVESYRAYIKASRAQLVELPLGGKK